jgi:hypothetical protein
MQNFTPEGLRVIDEVAHRHGVSREAVMNMALALAAGCGSQAQFNHPDLGGMGQWSRGGMIMVGDMFNNGLKHRVDMLCNELAPLVQDQRMAAVSQSQSQHQGSGGVSLFVRGAGASAQWWPDDLGAPASVGAQNDLRYAFFPAARRLAIQIGAAVRVYDTGAHQISGFSQQQSGDQTLTFTSQLGLVRVDDLPLVAPRADRPEAPVAPAAPAASAPPQEPAAAPPAPFGEAPASAMQAQPAGFDIIATIERLAELRQKGILTDEEFATKKMELLSRL